MNGATVWMTRVIAVVSAALIAMEVRGQDSCAGYCGEQAPGGCWCDVDCIVFSDCCTDAAEFCCDTWPGIVCDPFGCSGACGGQSGEGCWCDASCCDFFDCCDDKCEACGESHGNCDIFGPCVTESSPCGRADAGDCCSANDSPGCNNAACCEAVCACDPFCCNVMWDHFCAHPGFSDDMCPCGFGMCNATGHSECAHCLLGPCQPEAGDCCSSNGTKGCEDPACCDIVCAADPFCCNVMWDNICANAAHAACAVCQPPGGEGCSLGFWKQPHHFEHWQGHSPDDLFPDVFWVGGTPSSNCCENQCVSGNPTGCDDAECEAIICASDPFCCDICWDFVCADAATATCEVCLAGDALQTDAFMGMTLHEVLSQPSGPPQPDAPPQLNNLGKQAVAALLNASSGMSYAFTENEVKTMFIEAHYAWKAGESSPMIEVKNAFAEQNSAGCALSHPADLNLDEVVDVFDVLIILGNWGKPGLGDVNEDGVVDVFDLLIALSAWGPV